jgi:hypothetical protein
MPIEHTTKFLSERTPNEPLMLPIGGGTALTFDREVSDYYGRGKTIMIKKLSVLILAATLLAGCYPFESYPRRQTTTTTTITCPAGTQLQSDGMCR